MKNKVTIEESGDSARTPLGELRGEPGDWAVYETSTGRTDYAEYVDGYRWKFSDCSGFSGSECSWPARLLPRGTVIRIEIGGDE